MLLSSMLLAPRSVVLPSLLALCCLLLPPFAFGQASLSKTTLGHSQNSPQDLQNSLIPGGPQKVGKGEKKSEVDPKTLPSKKSNDTMFSGGLNDVGLDWGGDNLGKPHTGGSDADSKKAKQSDTEAKKAPAKSADASDNAQAKESKSTSSKPEKQPDKDKSVDTAKR